jgi:polyisoprenyl-phosphate glycosyltransferase
MKAQRDPRVFASDEAGVRMTRQMHGPVLLSVVVPCFNEEDALRSTHARLSSTLAQLPADFEIIYVDDGSTDATPEVLRELQAGDSHIRVVRFSRNFGHQMAITAGLEHGAGDAVVIIDADLQDPPETILTFFSKWQEGYDVVHGVRTEREGETAFKLWTARLFYRFMKNLSDIPIALDAGDFRLIDRGVLNALLSMPERDRFVRGMVSWLGFSQVTVPYRRGPRVAGATKFSFFKMLRFAMDGIFSFSILPLRVATCTGFITSFLAILGIVLVSLEHFLGVEGLVRGWTSTMFAVLFIGGVQLICMGIIGEYIGRIYGESKHRPLYVVREMLGFKGDKRETNPSSLFIAGKH